MQTQVSERIETLMWEIERTIKRKFPRLDSNSVEDVRQEVLLRLTEKVGSGELDWADDEIIPAMEDEIANAKRKVLRPTPKHEATSFPCFRIRPLYRTPEPFEIPGVEDSPLEDVQYASEGISYLSSKQKGIVQLVIDGCSKNDIQQRLGISHESLNRELNSILQKPELRESALASWMGKNAEPKYSYLHNYWKDKKEVWWANQVDAAKPSVDEPHIQHFVATNRVVVADPTAVSKSRENVKKEVAILRMAKIGSLFRNVESLLEFLLSQGLNVKNHRTNAGEFCIVVRMETFCCGAKRAMYIYNNLPVNPRKGHRWWWYCWCCEKECWDVYPNNLEGALLNIHDWDAAEIVAQARDYIKGSDDVSQKALQSLNIVNSQCQRENRKSCRVRGVNRKLPRRVEEWIAGHARY